MDKIISRKEALKEYCKNNYSDIIEKVEQKVQEAAKKGSFCVYLDDYQYKTVYDEFKKRGFNFNDNLIRWGNPSIKEIENNNAAYYKNIAEQHNDLVLKEIEKRIKDILKDSFIKNLDLHDLEVSDIVSIQLANAGYNYHNDTKMLYVIY